MKIAALTIILTTNSLLAMPVYRYDWWWYTSLGTPGLYHPELGQEGSGYIDFRQPYGTDVPLHQAIADIWVRGFNGVDTRLDGGFTELSPPLPAPIISGLQDSVIGSFDATAPVMSWDESQILGGFWFH
jgi:hypothetical protein